SRDARGAGRSSVPRCSARAARSSDCPAPRERRAGGTAGARRGCPCPRASATGGPAATGPHTPPAPPTSLSTPAAPPSRATRPHNTLYNGRWESPTFEEVLNWQDEQTRKRGRQVWIYPETKHPTYFRKLGLGLEERVAKLLRKYGKDKRNSPVILQSFEPTS